MSCEMCERARPVGAGGLVESYLGHFGEPDDVDLDDLWFAWFMAF